MHREFEESIWQYFFTLLLGSVFLYIGITVLSNPEEALEYASKGSKSSMYVFGGFFSFLGTLASLGSLWRIVNPSIYFQTKSDGVHFNLSFFSKAHIPWQAIDTISVAKREIPVPSANSTHTPMHEFEFIVFSLKPGSFKDPGLLLPNHDVYLKFYKNGELTQEGEEPDEAIYHASLGVTLREAAEAIESCRQSGD